MDKRFANHSLWPLGKKGFFAKTISLGLLILMSMQLFLSVAPAQAASQPGSSTDNPANLGGLPPVIVTQPLSISITTGSPAILTVVATSALPLSYQWYRGNAGDTTNIIVGANSSLLTLPNLSSSTNVWVRVSNSAGNTDSLTATITVQVAAVAPTIVTQPLNISITSGSNAVLSVVAVGSLPLSYQWYRGNTGDTTNIIVGATSSLLTLPGLSSTTNVWVRISNSAGSVASVTATITVQVAPVAPTIVVQPVSLSISSGSTATLSVTAAGTLPLSFQWYRGITGDISSPIVGANSSIYVSLPLTANASFWVRVSNSAGSVDSATASVTISISGVAPTIVVQPVGISVSVGSTAILAVTATGTLPLSFQWYQGISGDITNPISGAISSLFTTPALSVTTSFWVRVSNPLGSVDSDTATIIVVVGGVAPTIATQPASQAITMGGTATMSVEANGTAPLSYQWYQGNSGDTSSPIGSNNKNYTTPALTVPTSYWVRVSNSVGSANSNTATITPVATSSTITVNPASLPNGTVGTNYNQTISATGGNAPYTFAVTSGSLPANLTLSSAGVLSGNLVAAGNFSFTITATDASNNTGSRSYSLVVSNPGTTPSGTITLLPATVRLANTIDNSRPKLTATGINPSNPPDSSAVSIQATGTNGIPANATGIVGVLTNVGCTGGGNLRFWAGSSVPTNANNLNIPGANSAMNLSASFTAPLDASGKVNLGLGSGANISCGYAVDVAGYITPVGTGSNLSLLPATVRVATTLDNSRPKLTATGTNPSNPPDASAVAIQAAGMNGIPANATGIVGVLTNVGCSGGGNLRFWAGSSVPTNANNLNIPGANFAVNLSASFIAPLDANGKVNLGLGSGANISCGYAVDVTGYVTPAGTGNDVSLLPATVRVATTIDNSRPKLTATGINPSNPPDTSAVSIQLGGVNGIPANAKGVVGVLTNVGCSGGGNLRFWAGTNVPTNANNLNVPGANFALNLSASFTAPIDANGKVNLGIGSGANVSCGYAVDITGYIK